MKLLRKLTVCLTAPLQLIKLAGRQLHSDAAAAAAVRASGGARSTHLPTPALISVPAPNSTAAPTQVIRPGAEVGRVRSVPSPGGSPSSSLSAGQGFRPVKRSRGAEYQSGAAVRVGAGAHTLLQAASDNSQSFAFNHYQSE